MIRYFAFLLLLFLHLNALAQYDSIVMPLDIPIRLSGTFAELRSNHFHSGIDIRTQEIEGLPVRVIEDGYVSRINISPFGFGKAVYITHPDGITSVYAHLSTLAEPLSLAVREEQYRKESFSVDFLLPRNNIRVQKGQIIAWSGNSGGSSGPHLHFELRKTSSQHPVNPMLYGYTVPDNIPPVIEGIRVYPIEGKGLVNGSTAPYNLMFQSNNAITVMGQFYLGIKTYDRQNEAPSKDGPFEISLYVDGELFWQIRFDEFSYNETRYANSLIDYASYYESRQRYLLTRVQPHNDLDLYQVTRDRGILNLTDEGTHQFKYEVRDFGGNITVKEFIIKSQSGILPSIARKENATLLSSSIENRFEAKGVLIDFPAKSFYEDTLAFTYSTSPKTIDALTSLHHIHTPTVPLHKAIALQMSSAGVPKSLQSKTLIVRIDNDGGVNYLTTKLKGAWFQARIREFGIYTLMVDTIPPIIKALNIYDGKDMFGESNVRFQIVDSQSGIVKYRMTIDGQWVIAEYEPKSNLLFYEFDANIGPGSHILVVEVSDDANNKNAYSVQFKR